MNDMKDKFKGFMKKHFAFKNANSVQNKSSPFQESPPNRKPADGFDPFDSLITTGKRSQNGYCLNVFQCPICGQSYGSEGEVSVHVETCVNDNNSNNNGCSVDGAENGMMGQESSGSGSQVSAITAYVPGKPPEGSVEVVLRLLRNVVNES